MILFSLPQDAVSDQARAVRAMVVLFLTAFAPMTLAACGELPQGFQPWPASRPTPVEAIPADHWYAMPEGWVLAPNRCAAVMAAAELRAAFDAHREHFGAVEGFGAIVALDHATHAAALRGAGADWILPWRFAAPRASAADGPRAAAVRAQIEEQLGAEADPAHVDAMVEQALQQLGAGSSSGGSNSGTLEPKAIRHEVAHLLYLEQVWPSSKAAGEQYGGDAPDWLDETVAVAAESASMTADRRRSFRQAVEQDELIPLNEFLSMTHPVFGGSAFAEMIEQARARARAGEPTLLSGSVDAADSARAILFYAQARGFFDYLASKIDQPDWLGDLSKALREGRSFEQWIEDRPAVDRLPARLEALESDFLSWSRESAGRS